MLHQHANEMVGGTVPNPTGHMKVVLEVAYLRAELHRLATRLAGKDASNPEEDVLGVPFDRDLQRHVRAISRARERRSEFLPAALFADPAWDMLLELYQCEISQIRVSVSSLCAASQVPATTALRWIKHLEDEGLAYRRNDPIDARRVYIALTDKGMSAMVNYFSEVSPPLGV